MLPTEKYVELTETTFRHENKSNTTKLISKYKTYMEVEQQHLIQHHMEYIKKTIPPIGRQCS